jgi:hypothetical protein
MSEQGLEIITKPYQIIILESAGLNSNQKNLFSRLNNFEAPYLKEKLIVDGKMSS